MPFFWYKKIETFVNNKSYLVYIQESGLFINDIPNIKLVFVPQCTILAEPHYVKHGNRMYTKVLHLTFLSMLTYYVF